MLHEVFKCVERPPQKAHVCIKHLMDSLLFAAWAKIVSTNFSAGPFSSPFQIDLLCQVISHIDAPRATASPVLDALPYAARRRGPSVLQASVDRAFRRGAGDGSSFGAWRPFQCGSCGNLCRAAAAHSCGWLTVS